LLGAQYFKHNLRFFNPDIDESRKVNETPEQLVFRLAQEKAFEVAKTRSGFIIASDQVATLGDKILTKPHSHENAVKQLEKSSGNTVTFLTSLALLDTHTDTIDTVVEKSKIVFKVLSAKEIEYYLQKEKPYSCAGSFKSEALGICVYQLLWPWTTISLLAKTMPYLGACLLI
jgi:MAF protein